MTKSKKILLGQLNSNGDCLYATTIARQIKSDFPDCHLTWAIGSMCRSILEGNPYINEIWEVPLTSIGEVVDVWPRFEREVMSRKSRGDFDEVFITQIAPGNLHNYDGTIRSSIFNAYPHPITVPVAPVLRLTEVEVENTRLFAEKNHLADKANVILFECSPKSGQSSVTPGFALEVAQKLIANISDVCVILSSNIPTLSNNKQIIDGSVLSFRENAELTKYCTLLIGCSSGISWLCTSDWAKPLPMIQMIKSDANWFASVVIDHEQWGLPTSSIIELSDNFPDRLYKCVFVVLSESFNSARLIYHENIRMHFDYFEPIQYQLLRSGKIIKALLFLNCNIRRHGLRSMFILWPFYRLKKKALKLFADVKTYLYNL